MDLEKINKGIEWSECEIEIIKSIKGSSLIKALGKNIEDYIIRLENNWLEKFSDYQFTERILIFSNNFKALIYLVKISKNNFSFLLESCNNKSNYNIVNSYQIISEDINYKDQRYNYKSGINEAVTGKTFFSKIYLKNLNKDENRIYQFWITDCYDINFSYCKKITSFTSYITESSWRKLKTKNIFNGEEMTYF